MAKTNKKPQVSFQQVLDALLDDSQSFPPSYLHHFSDLNPVDLARLKKSWSQVSAKRRQALLEDLEELSEADTLVNFDDVGQMALGDSEASVRVVAVRLLWECENPKLTATYITMLQNDPNEQVRAAAASALGRFVYLGEIEEIPEKVKVAAEEALLTVYRGQDAPLVRRRSLEALGASGRDEVDELIQSAYNRGDSEWVSSAVFAMGRSANNRWEKIVLDCLAHPVDEVRAEAVRAAGQLELASARQELLDMLDDENLSDEIYMSAVWSLSQIGGEEVRERLVRLLEESADDEESEFLEEALENLDFTEDMSKNFDLFDFSEEDEDDTADDGKR